MTAERGKFAAAEDRGFTLIEVLVVIAALAIIAGIALPEYAEYKTKARVSAVATDLKNFESAFHAFLVDNEDYPADTHLVLPPGMESYIATNVWSAETQLGGNYNWEGPNFYPYAGISIYEPEADMATLAILDRMLDDGNLAVGRFRIGTNGRPTLILEE